MTADTETIAEARTRLERENRANRIAAAVHGLDIAKEKLLLIAGEEGLTLPEDRHAKVLTAMRLQSTAQLLCQAGDTCHCWLSAQARQILRERGMDNADIDRLIEDETSDTGVGK